MNCSTSDIALQEARKDEIKALKAIYIDDFEEIQKDVSHKPYRFKLTIKPSGCLMPDKIFCSIKLDITLGANYPQNIPKIKVENVKGVSKIMLKEFVTNLRKSAKLAVGDVVVYQLALEAEEFITLYNEELKPLHEQMTKRKYEEDEEQKIKQELIQNKIKLQENLHNDKLQKRIEAEIHCLRKKNELEIERKNGGSAFQDNLYDNYVQEFSQDDQNNFIQKQNFDDMDVFGDEIDSEYELENYLSYENEENLQLERNVSKQDLHTKIQSRYESDFEEVEVLGSGGFGVVFKARNKLDGLYYAVKRIRLQNNLSSSNIRIIREVTTIARLQHQHIVRYFQAWIEKVDKQTLASITDKFIDSENIFEINYTDEDCDKNFSSDYSTDDEEISSASENISIGEVIEKNKLNQFDDWLDDCTSTSNPLNIPLFVDRDRSINEEFSSKKYSSLNINNGLDSNNAKIENRLDYIQYLYIQMEFCPKNTLRDAIIADEISLNLKQRFFRQIVEAIAFLHSKGTIHRDIKPSNIFISKDNNVKLGDFGLAMPDSTVLDNLDKVNNSEDNNSLSSDLKEANASGIVGTPFYRAPEQEIRGQKLTSKVDMYPLGIILYEMFRPFKTEMERMHELKKLRKSNKVPDEFREKFEFDINNDSEFENRVSQLIEKLLDSNPDNRPSAFDLLQSGVIPYEIENRHIEKTLNEIMRSSLLRQRVVKNLFLTKPEDHIDFTYDLQSEQFSWNSSRTIAENKIAPFFLDYIQCQVFSKIKKIFKAHSLIELTIPLFTPKINFFNDFQSVSFIDSTGTIVCLPYNLMKPFARYIAQKGILSIRRFYIGHVFRHSVTGGQPKHLNECHIDLVSPSKNNNQSLRTSLDAEAIFIVHELLLEFDKIIGPFKIRISHLNIFDVILDKLEPYFSSKSIGENDNNDETKNSKKLRQDICVLMSLLGRPQWPQSIIRRTLLYEKHLDPKCVEQLRAYTSIKGDFQFVLTKLLETFYDNAKLVDAIDQLGKVNDFLMNFECKNILIDCGLVILYDSCKGNSGLIFQAVTDSKVLPYDILAQGGRYDHLLESYKLPNSSSVPVFAIGASIAIEKIINKISLSKYPMSYWRDSLSEPSVLLFSINDALILERAKTARILQQMGIRTEYILSRPLSLQEALLYCKYMGIKFLVNFRENDFISSGNLSIHSLVNKSSKRKQKYSTVLGRNCAGSVSASLNEYNNSENGIVENVLYRNLFKQLQMRIGNFSSNCRLMQSKSLAKFTTANTKLALGSIAFDVRVISLAVIKPHSKLKIIQQTRNALASFVKNFPNELIYVLAIDLSFITIRNCLTKIMQIIENYDTFNNKDLVNDYYSSNFQNSNSYINNSNNSSASNKENDTILKLIKIIDEKIRSETIKQIFIYSILDKNFDMINLNID